MIKKGSWVLVYDIVLKADERTANLPEDTKNVPLEMWTKGFLVEDGEVGQTVEIKTITGRLVKGTLVEVDPHHEHDFGKFVPEILQIGIQLKDILWGGEANE